MTIDEISYRKSQGPWQAQGTAMAVGKWLTIGLLAAMLAMTGCQKGDPGPAGPDGKNGTDGNNGINGINGKNGVPYNEAIRNGSIITYLDGKTPAGDPFKDTLTFKFSSSDLYESSFYYYNSNDIQFRLERFATLDNYSIQDYLSFDIEYYDPGEGAGPYYYFDHYLSATVATTDFRYFKFAEDYYDTEGSNVLNASFDGFNFDPSTGHLYFLYSWTVPANSNRTGYDLVVSGVVDVTVYMDESD